MFYTACAVIRGGDWFLLYRYVVGDGFCYLQTMFPLRSS